MARNQAVTISWTFRSIFLGGKVEVEYSVRMSFTWRSTECMARCSSIAVVMMPADELIRFVN